MYTAGTDVAMEATNAYSTGLKYAIRGIASGTGDTNTGLFTTADGATSNYGLRIYNIPSATNNFAIYSDSYAKSYFLGDVGIGTTSPGALQEIFQSSGGTNGLRLNTNFSGGNAIDFNPFIPGVSNGGFSISQAGNIRFVVNNSGKVGIGTTNPDQLLSVNGTIHSKEVLVDLTGWSDYVFKPAYRLPSLSAVKSYIDKNHHLPEIPAEEDMVKNGLSVSEMNKLLMKKVEELTLYLIEKDKQVKTQQKMIESQGRKDLSLQSQLNLIKRQLKTALTQQSAKH